MTSPTTTRLRPEGLVHSPAFSHVAVIPPGARIVLVGGQNAVNAAGDVAGGDDLAAQAAQVFTNLETALAAGGATLADVVQWRIAALDGLDPGPAVAELQRRWDPDVAPPLISVTLVSGLAVPGALFELDAVAAVADPSQEA